MKKLVVTILILYFSIFTLSSCSLIQSEYEKKGNLIPESSITYKGFSFGNVIDEGKRAVFLHFSSEYPVNKIKASGVILDINGNEIFTFNDEISYNTPNKNVLFVVMVNSNLVSYVFSATFTKIKAYTQEKIKT